jgi:hypothetical protein
MARAPQAASALGILGSQAHVYLPIQNEVLEWLPTLAY